MGEVSLLQDDQDIPEMPVGKVYPHRCPYRCSSHTSLNWTVPQSPRVQEGHNVYLRFLAGGRGPPTPSPLRCPLMLCLHVSRQWPERHLLHVLLSMDPTLLSLQVGRYYSRHPYPVPRLQICPCRLVQAADHSDCLPDVSLQAHPVKQAYRGAERDLEPSLVQRCDHVIVPVEEGILMSALLSAPVLLFRALHHH